VDTFLLCIPRTIRLYAVTRQQSRDPLRLCLAIPHPTLSASIDKQFGCLNRLTQEIETAVFRIVQEALTNVYRHSKAEVARIEIMSDEESLLLRIKDNGTGIPANMSCGAPNGRTGVGLASMRERAALLGGTFGIESDAEGTTVSVSIPIPKVSRVASA
jgi:two-component system sensor histidine kinase UhpB